MTVPRRAGIIGWMAVSRSTGSPEDTASFGQELRREREVRDVSLQEIAKATKIGVRFLEALEKDDFDALPAPVFTKGFIREFSKYLGLDPEKMVNSWNYHRQLREQDSSTAKRMREIQEQAAAAPPIPWRGIFALLGLAVGAVILFVLVRRGFEEASPAPESGPGLAATAAASWIAPAPTPAPPATAAPISGELVLRLQCSEETWFELGIDGRAQISELLASGTTREFRATDSFLLTLGNAGGVKATLDGRPLPSFGSPAQVVRGLRIDRDGLRTEAPTQPATGTVPPGSVDGD